MKAIPTGERQRLGAQLDTLSQDQVMARIPQFSEAEVHNLADVPADAPRTLDALVFNMERGVHLREIGDFLETCPDARPFDIILANELDDGCVRSGQRDTTRELAARLGMNFAFGLEFIELVNPEDEKGYHGNAIFSRFPILWAQVVRLPEQYNWYFDRQRRIGGRLAVLAELDLGNRRVGVGTIHLENRTDGSGRQAQLETVLEAADRLFPGDMPVILGGDLNTNTFDGRDKAAIQAVAGDAALQRRCLEEVADWEGCLPAAQARGYRAVPVDAVPTRRKPLPGGGFLGLRLDWLLVRGLAETEGRIVSTRREDCGFALPGSALEAFAGQELSDHNAVWSRLVFER